MEQFIKIKIINLRPRIFSMVVCTYFIPYMVVYTYFIPYMVMVMDYTIYGNGCSLSFI